MATANMHWIGPPATFLMPSQYEPCGLNQMQPALRYHSRARHRRTGRPVQHFSETRLGTGIVFNDYDAAGLTWAVVTALEWHSQSGL